jgi:hypothetical protein
MGQVPEVVKELVISVVRKPIFVLMGITFTTTLTTGFLLGRWYGSRKIRQYNRREDLYPLEPKSKFDWNRLKFWEHKPATSETVSVTEPCAECNGFGLPNGQTCTCGITGRG